ncbi:hypothetical protein L9F63_001494 [Diploptera punctata]|uniref:cyclin-dependent kinase n=1 Tax=Diploptera punctata TaxID=6984 RepID=A0AAD8A3X4_DIPPU|nr:hypothetical protein L9F63_001494 [Diploptera punctata]
MEKYENIAVVGEGSYGLVIKCRHRETGQMVAIKKFIETEEDQTVRKMALREIRMLKKLRHENLVNMIEVFRRKRRFYLVFEYMDHTVLDELEKNSSGLGTDTSREYIFQVLRGIDFCHNNNIVHRDVKPENVLVSQLGVIKLCDFGFARLLANPGETCTDYVATRWYRAPELLVGDTKYGREVDIWAVGCLFAEMMTGDPLFPGDSDIDQLYQITKVLGQNIRTHLRGNKQRCPPQLREKRLEETPENCHTDINSFLRNPMLKGLKKGMEEGARSLYKMFPNWSKLSLDFVTLCLKLDPAQRPISSELIRHPFFNHDRFSEHFLPVLRAKIQDEFQGNPLLQKYQTSPIVRSAAKIPRERGPSELSVSSSHLRGKTIMEQSRWKINIMKENSGCGDNTRQNLAVSSRRKVNDSTATMDVTEEPSDTRTFKLPSQHKFSIPSLQLNKVQLSVQDIGPSDVQPSSAISPTPFLSLESAEQFVQVLHPSINNLSFTGFKEPERPIFTGKAPESLKRSPMAQSGSRTPLTKVPLPPSSQFRRLGRNLLLDVGELQKTGINSVSLNEDSPVSDKWFFNRKPGIAQACDTWRIKNVNDDFSLPNVPGASGSPSKGLKKKLHPISTHGSQMNEPFISPKKSQKPVVVSRPKKHKLPSLDFLPHISI